MKKLNLTNNQEKYKLKSQWDNASHLLEWLLSKRQKIISIGNDVKKRESLYTVGGNVDWYSGTATMKTIMEVPQK